jgi:hypothetical protein
MKWTAQRSESCLKYFRSIWRRWRGGRWEGVFWREADVMEWVSERLYIVDIRRLSIVRIHCLDVDKTNWCSSGNQGSGGRRCLKGSPFWNIGFFHFYLSESIQFSIIFDRISFNNWMTRVDHVDRRDRDLVYPCHSILTTFRSKIRCWPRRPAGLLVNPYHSIFWMVYAM